MDIYRKLVITFSLITLAICIFSAYVANINVYLGALSLFGLIAINFGIHELIFRHISKNIVKSLKMPNVPLVGVLSNKKLPFVGVLANKKLPNK